MGGVLHPGREVQLRREFKPVVDLGEVVGVRVVFKPFQMKLPRRERRGAGSGEGSNAAMAAGAGQRLLFTSYTLHLALAMLDRPRYWMGAVAAKKKPSMVGRL